MTNTRKLIFVNIAAFVLMILFNGLANGLPLNGYTTGELSDMYPNLFVPAGLTFGIWGVIYTLLLIFIGTQIHYLIKKNADHPAAQFVPRIGWYFAVNGIANATWIVVWHYQLPVVALGIMLIILWSLIRIYQQLGIGREQVSTGVKLTAHVPFSIYLAWICVATIANVTTVLVDLGYTGGENPEIYAVTMIFVAGLLGLWFLFIRKDYAYAAVIVWATYGIWLKRINTEPVVESVAYSGLTAAIVVGVSAIIWAIFRSVKFGK